MVAVNSVTSFNGAPIFDKNNKVKSAYVAPQMMDTVELSKKVPKSGLMHELASKLKLFSLTGAGALLAAACTMGGVTPGPDPTPTPSTPSAPTQPTTPTTPAAVENAALTKSLNNLNPIIQDSTGAKVSGASVSDLSLDSIDSWSHTDSTGTQEVTTIKSIDSTTGAAKVTVEDFDDLQQSQGAKNADLVKVNDTTARVKFNDTDFTDMKVIDNGVRQSATYKSLPAEQVDLKPIAQGLDAKYDIGTTTKVGEWSNVIVKLKITAKALSEQKALRALIK